ncbi:T0105232 isoform 2, partial [Pongo abelii]
IVDGQELRTNPAASMESIQKFLGLMTIRDFGARDLKVVRLAV